jgi:hypothetical protein
MRDACPACVSLLDLITLIISGQENEVWTSLLCKFVYFLTYFILRSNILLRKNRDSSVGVATGYGLDDRMNGVRISAGVGNFSLRHRVQTGSGAHPASYSVGTKGFFPGVKRPGREADHSPPPSHEVRECVELCLHYSNTPSSRGD